MSASSFWCLRHTQSSWTSGLCLSMLKLGGCGSQELYLAPCRWFSPRPTRPTRPTPMATGRVSRCSLSTSPGCTFCDGSNLCPKIPGTVNWNVHECSGFIHFGRLKKWWRGFLMIGGTESLSSALIINLLAVVVESICWLKGGYCKMSWIVIFPKHFNGHSLGHPSPVKFSSVVKRPLFLVMGFSITVTSPCRLVAQFGEPPGSRD